FFHCRHRRCSVLRTPDVIQFLIRIGQLAGLWTVDTSTRVSQIAHSNTQLIQARHLQVQFLTEATINISEHINQGFLLTLGSKQQDRKSTRLNSSHVKISYAVFCSKKKNTQYTITITK